MKKILYRAAYEVDLIECEIPEISEDQVLLKMVGAGICGSDSQIYHGKHRYMTFPVVGGHEGSAVIEKVGKNVTGFAPGDRVAIEPQVVCGECYPCKIGRFNVCENLKVLGTHTEGLMAEYVALSPKYLHLCPPDMDFDLITLVEPMAVGVGSVKRSHYKDANIAVIGAGTIGNLIAQAAQALGAKSVLITDIVDKKLDYARACGIEHCVNTSGQTLRQAIESVFSTRGADVIIDAVGLPFSFQAALDAARPSSEIVVTGNFKEPVTIELPRMQRREVNLIGHMMYVREDYEDAIRFLYEKKVRVDGFITQRFPFEDPKAAFEFIDSHPGDILKAVFTIHSL